MKRVCKPCSSKWVQSWEQLQITQMFEPKENPDQIFILEAALQLQGEDSSPPSPYLEDPQWKPETLGTT